MKLSALRHGLVKLMKRSKKEDPDPFKKKKEGTLQKFRKKMQITCMGKKTQLTSGFPTSNGRGWSSAYKG